MKKIILSLTLVGATLSVNANFTTTGYYRVKNNGTQRWAVLIDDKASVDFFSESADLHALQLNNDTEEILSDPGSIVLITQENRTDYIVAAQGVSLDQLVDTPINIRTVGSEGDQDLYRLSGTYKGVTKYIGDGNIVNSDQYGDAGINVSNSKNLNWQIIPVQAATDNFYGPVPSINAGGNLYTTVFTSFAYKPYSEGVKAYYIGRVGYGMAEMIEITGAVPPGSPVVVQCAGENASDNRMELLQLEDALPNNSLNGVYFNYSSNTIKNQKAYDPNTMRVLGLCSDGSLGFVTSDIKVIPANTAYLTVPAGSLPELKCVSTAEYDANLPIAPEVIYLDENNQLLPQGDDTYVGTFTIPVPEGSDKDLYLNFYYPGNNNEENILGPFSGENVVLNSITTLPYKIGSESYWVIRNWIGGEIKITINIKNQNVQFYSETLGVESIEAEDAVIRYDGKTVYTNLSGELKLYDLSGKLITVSNTGNLDVSSLTKGIYLVTSNGKSLKIVR